MKAPGFDSLTLRAVVSELRDTLVGGQVQKVRQPDEHTIVLRIHHYPENRRLLFCAHPERFRAHLTTQDLPNPSPPPTFCMALRKYLEGGRITDVRQDGADRVLRLTCATSWGDLQLVAELMGRHSNLVLLDEGGAVLEAVKHVGPKLSHRVILPGRPYPPVPPSGRPSLWDAPAETLDALWAGAPQPVTAKWLLEVFGGMSPFLAQTVLASGNPRDALAGIVAETRASHFKPTLYLAGDATPAGAWPFPSLAWPAERMQPSPSMGEALDAAYATRSTAAKREALLRELNAILDREARALEHRRADLRRIEEEVERADSWRIAGELLTANAHAVAKGAESVSLPNYYEPDLAPMEIALDPTLSPRENAEAYFARQHKAKAAAERLPEQSKALDERAAALVARRAEIASAHESTLERLLAEWSPAQEAAAPKGKKPEPEYPPGVRIRKYTSDEGFQIWVGENATGNDYLTTKASDPDDIWLHVRAAASAHGVIRTNRKPDSVPPATLRKAAALVAARSEAKASGTIPVDYTLRRYVRKPRGAAPGRVTYEREKTLYVGPDQE